MGTVREVISTFFPAFLAMSICLFMSARERSASCTVEPVILAVLGPVVVACRMV